MNLFSTWEHHKVSQDEAFEAEHEFQAMLRLFGACEKIQLKVFCLYSNSSLIGFSIFEPLNKDTAICHFAKVNQNFAGAHDYIMKMQAEWLFANSIRTLNYEQDLGIANLKHSKLSFRPESFLKKYIVILK